ncbi:IQ-domain 10 [Perilla frutescens var. hirtella]|nr:IQ-domain 10 [Perilla frutescens var. hirtella]
MGSGDCFKNIISLKRSKNSGRKSIKPKGNKHSTKYLANGGSRKNAQLTEAVAAIRIQSAFRAHKARKTLRGLKGIDRFRGVIEEGHYSVKNQAMSALNQIHFWSRIQTEIRARWLGMVVESRARQKKLENQLKLDAKLHDLEVEWSGGPETMEEVLNRIQQRETAAAKRERTMAYAFSHQWKANTNQYFGQSYYDLSKESWGWSWKERWVAVRPWEKRYQSSPSPIKKVEPKQKTGEATNPATTKPTVPVNTALSNGEVSAHARKSSRVASTA